MDDGGVFMSTTVMHDVVYCFGCCTYNDTESEGTTGHDLCLQAFTFCLCPFIICHIAIAYSMGQIIQETHQEMR